MTQYRFKGVDPAGRKVVGKIDAGSVLDVRMILRSQGIRPMKINKLGVFEADFMSMLTKGLVGVSLEVKVAFTRQLQVLISSGIPLIQALEVLTDQAVDANFRNILTVVKDKVAQGSYFWEALNGYNHVFPRLYIALVRAGETSGSLDQMLKRLTRYLEDADTMRKKVKSAMMYPVVVVTVGVAIIAGMLMFVIPKFEEILKTNNTELPAPTKFVIWLSHYLWNNFLIIAGCIGLVVYLTVRYIKSEEGRAFRDRLLFKAPLFGPILQKSAVARFARTLQTLLSSGINLLDAMDICRSTIDNAVLEDAVGRIRTDIEAGKTIGAVINKIQAFPKMAIQMIQVGESTGNLDKMLEKVADFYESDVDILVSGLTKLIEPFVLVFLGVAVGGIMIAMYLPIFKMAGGVSQD
jgi:type IV pilus assembly protein PilC